MWRLAISGVKLLAGLILMGGSCVWSQEVFEASLEARSLVNIQQVTFASMGFEKAGEAYFSPDGQSIVFQAVPVGQQHYQIYRLDLAEGKPHLVSTGLGACTCAYFRPDGQKIIFASSHSDPSLQSGHGPVQVPGYQRSGQKYVWAFTPYMNIYEANLDGTELVALTEGEAYNAECAYSPDGLRIVFVSNREGSPNLYTMRADGSDVQPVTHTTTCYNGGPFFSPDGRQIVFRADRDKPHYLQIYVVDIDGSHEQRVTDNGAVNWAPYWHPSGQVIAFTTSLHGHASYEIYLAHIEKKLFYRLTHNPTFDGLPVFSYDGTKLMWTSKRSDDGSCQIFMADFLLPSELE